MSVQSADASAPADRRDFVTALARGLQVLRAFGGQNQDMTLSEISRLVGLPRATVRRCLITLTELGYAESRGSLFRLSPQVLILARAYLESSTLPQVSQPFLERLSETLGQSCSVSILHGQDAVYVARSARRRMASLHRGVGTHLPAAYTSMGRVLLAALSEPVLDSFLQSVPLAAHTPFAVTDKAELKARVGAVRGQGYCIVDRELELDLRAIAVPVLSARGDTVAALNVSTQASQTPGRDLLGIYLPALKATAADMRALLPG